MLAGTSLSVPEYRMKLICSSAHTDERCTAPVAISETGGSRWAAISEDVQMTAFLRSRFLAPRI